MGTSGYIRLAGMGFVLATCQLAAAGADGGQPPSTRDKRPGASVFTRLHDKMTRADIERLGQTTTLGGYEGEISSQFSSEGHLKWVGVGIWRRKARCTEALQAVRRALESDFGAAHPPGFHMGSNVESLKGCYEWNPAGTTILACCRQHSAPDGGFEFMSLVVSQSFGPEKLIELDEGIP